MPQDDIVEDEESNSESTKQHSIIDKESEETIHTTENSNERNEDEIKSVILGNPWVKSYTTHRDKFIQVVPYGDLVWFTIKVIVFLGVAIGILMYLTGIASPFASVTSSSMEPAFERGDMAILTAHDDSSPLLSDSDEIITKRQSLIKDNGKYKHSFGEQGDVIVFKLPNVSTSIIHRAHLFVKKGENWVDRADPRLLNGKTTCSEVFHCPAPRTGYITAGDNNPEYDQVNKEYGIVEKEHVIGVVKYRLPHVGWVIIVLDKIMSL